MLVTSMSKSRTSSTHRCQTCAPPIARAVPRPVLAGAGSQNPRAFTARCTACTVFSRAPRSSSSWRTRSKKFGAELFHVWAAVEQEQLAGHHRQQCVVAVPEPIAPLGEHFTNPVDLTADPVATKDSHAAE